MVLKMVLNFGDFYWVLMVWRSMLDFDEFEDDAGF